MYIMGTVMSSTLSKCEYRTLRKNTLMSQSLKEILYVSKSTLGKKQILLQAINQVSAFIQERKMTRKMFSSEKYVRKYSSLRIN